MSSKTLNHNGYVGSVEVSLEDGCMHGEILCIDDLITYEAETIPDLQREFIAAVERYLAFCERTGKAPNKPYTGTFNVRISAVDHKAAAIEAKKEGISLNEFVKRSISSTLRSAAPVVNQINNYYGSTAKEAMEVQPYDEDLNQRWLLLEKPARPKTVKVHH